MSYLPIKTVAKLLGRSEPSCYRLLQALPHKFETELFSRSTTLFDVDGEYLSLMDASERLSFSPEVVRRMAKKGQIKTLPSSVEYERVVVKVEEGALLKYVAELRTNGFLSIPELCFKYKTCRRTISKIVKHNDVRRVREKMNGKMVWAYDEARIAGIISARRCKAGVVKLMKFNDKYKLEQWHKRGKQYKPNSDRKPHGAACKR